MSDMNQNMQDLMNAAKLKLEAQKRENNEVAAVDDIYAEMKQEMENDTYNPGSHVIKRHEELPEPEVILQTEIEPEEDYTIDFNDPPIFENGPRLSTIDIWKKQYSKEKIFHTQILEKHFVFRTLNRFEYKQIVAIENIDALYREEIICNTCVLWPSKYDFKAMAAEDGGYPSTLAQIIMENSGFTKEYGIEVL